LIYAVAFTVGGEFLLPEFQTRLGHAALGATFLAVPEATMHENDLAPRLEYEIGAAGEASAMKSIPVAKGMDEAAHAQFELGVLVADTAHPLAALLWSEGIHREILGTRLSRWLLIAAAATPDDRSVPG